MPSPKTNFYLHANDSDVGGWYETIGWLYLFQFLIFNQFFVLLHFKCRFRSHTHSSFFFFCHSLMILQALDDYEIEEDLPNAMKLLGEMNNNVKQVSDLVESMLQRVKSGELTTEYGLSFLEVRYHMLLTYLINLTYVVLRKCSGKVFEMFFLFFSFPSCFFPFKSIEIDFMALKTIHKLHFNQT